MKLYRSFATVGGLTMVSRILGFARDILIAAALGVGPVADAFFVAFRFPNLFRRLFGEGAFNSAFVPLFAKRLEGDGIDEARGFAEESFSVLLFTLLAFSTLAILAMPWLMMVLAPGFVTDPDKYNLAVLLTQVAFPYLLCMSLVALLSGALNSMDKFWAAAAAPILLNIVLILSLATIFWFGLARREEAGLILAIGVTLAGIAQFAMLWFAARNAGLRLKIRRPRYTQGVQRLVQLGIPGVISGGITQINIVVGTIIASLQAGAVSYLYYADRLYQLPLGIVGVAIGIVLLPDLARKLRAGDDVAASASQNRSLEFALLLTVPAAVALALTAEPIIRVLFERGAFLSTDTPKTAMALAAFSLGLPAFVLIKVFQPAFFAREDTKTPMRYAGYNLVVNVVGSLALFYMFKVLGLPPHVGIALATSIAGWVNAVMLWRNLSHHGKFVTDARLRRNLPLLVIASCAMGLVLWFALPQLGPLTSSSQALWVQVMALAGLVGLGLAVYGAMIAVTGIMPLRQLLRFGRER
ncbi:MAG: murein biosynthesis integral membrane protein MurJ [Hyphomicrobiaceae bacterium]